MIELRCEAKLHGMIDGAAVEVKCNSRFCGAGDGWVVLHTFSLSTGELISTERYKNPPTPNARKEQADARSGNSAAVRYS